MAAKKLSKSERGLDAKMLAIIEHATKHPRRWHDIGPESGWQRSAELLAQRGAIEIRQPQNQYRFVPPKYHVNTPEEEAAINAGIAADPDTYELTDAEMRQLKPWLPLGRPKTQK